MTWQVRLLEHLDLLTCLVGSDVILRGGGGLMPLHRSFRVLFVDVLDSLQLSPLVTDSPRPALLGASHDDLHPASLVASSLPSRLPTSIATEVATGRDGEFL